MVPSDKTNSPNSLKGYATTTIKNMLINVCMFIKHVKDAFLNTSELNVSEVESLLYELKRIQADVHQQNILQSEKQLDAVQAKQFMTISKERIPKLLDGLLNKTSNDTEHRRVMGYILGYMSILTGHRSVVFTSITKQNINYGERLDNGKVQVPVEEHQTLCLTGEEFQWLEDLSSARCCDDAQCSDLVLHTLQGGKIEKPSTLLSLAWEDAGMAGSVSFNLIRSSVSTQAHEYLSPRTKGQVAGSMCHDPSSARKVPAALHDKDTSFATMEQRMGALEKDVKNRQSTALNESSTQTSEDSTGSQGEHPFSDDCLDTTSSLSEEVAFKRHRQVKQLIFSSEGEMQQPARKRRLSFSDIQDFVPKSKKNYLYTPSKIRVPVEKLSEGVVKYYTTKATSNYKMLGKGDTKCTHPESETPSEQIPEIIPRSQTEIIKLDQQEPPETQMELIAHTHEPEPET